MASIWDERFAGEGYVYGTAPNAWLESELRHQPHSGLVEEAGLADRVA